jgi:hypothetical protein
MRLWIKLTASRQLTAVTQRSANCGETVIAWGARIWPRTRNGWRRWIWKAPSMWEALRLWKYPATDLEMASWWTLVAIHESHFGVKKIWLPMLYATQKIAFAVFCAKLKNPTWRCLSKLRWARRANKHPAVKAGWTARGPRQWCHSTCPAFPCGYWL